MCNYDSYYNDSEILIFRIKEYHIPLTTLQVCKKSSITLPVELRSKYGVDEGDIFTLIDLGDGSFLLTPRISAVNRLGNRVAETMAQYNLTEDDLIAALDEEREAYYREHFIDKPQRDEKA